MGELHTANGLWSEEVYLLKFLSMFEIKNLVVTIDSKKILKGISLDIKPGELHAIMGPNGSGKSTTAYALAGHPNYQIESGDVLLNNQDVLEMSPDERAQAGVFLAFQYPVEVPGVKVDKFLYLSHQAIFGDKSKQEYPSLLAFRKHLVEVAESLEVDLKLIKRSLNENFSGGEKKRLEILQMAILQPKFAVLDETDSGLDIDAIKAVAAGVKKIQKQYKTSILVITHYQRILDYLEPDFIHVMKAGKIVESGGAELAEKLESKGYGGGDG